MLQPKSSPLNGSMRSSHQRPIERPPAAYLLHHPLISRDLNQNHENLIIIDRPRYISLKIQRQGHMFLKQTLHGEGA